MSSASGLLSYALKGEAEMNAQEKTTEALQRQKVYADLVQKHGPVWIDAEENYHPLKFMGKRYLTNCYRLVSKRIKETEGLIAKVEEYLDILENSVSAGFVPFGVSVILQGEMALDTVDREDQFDRVADLPSVDDLIAAKQRHERMADALARQLKDRFGFDIEKETEL